MKFSQEIRLGTSVELCEKILRIDEFLKEYWGYSIFKVSDLSTGVLDNRQFIQQLSSIQDKESIDLFAFLDIKDFEELKKSDYQCTPRKAEIFSFCITKDIINVNFYNSDEGMQRECQFYKIVDRFKETIEQPIPLVRIFRCKDGTINVMCHHRSKEGKIGFSFSSDKNEEADCLFIYWVDFEIIRSSIVEGFNISCRGTDVFDNTSCNEINKSGCIHIIESLRNKTLSCNKEKAFVEYITNWFEKQTDKMVCVFGNL